MDAVSSMLYLDYDRGHGEWQANIHGGKENLEAVEFLKTLNLVVEEEFPQVLMIAEESTAWPKMTLPVEQGGMGFDYKWNMGWMNDTLKYMSLAEGDRKNNSHLVTFSITYAFGENYILPFSHDEVVHLKKSLLRKMPGDKGEMLENLRAMMGYMMAHPGKKLLFMGGELAQEKEWDFEGSLQWELLEQDEHQEFNEFMQALNHFYKSTSSLWERDTDEEGFQWINIETTKEGVVSFQRRNLKGEPLIVIGNFTGKTVKNLALPPWKGKYEVAFSTSSKLGGISITAKGLTIPAYTTGFIRREAH
jgi:1,4-alpha-glucan branching enzyme